ncbi:MAG: deoxyribose-phosphate aldolase [candidate division NC10 bacterium]
MPARKNVPRPFDPVAFLPLDLYAAITEVRIERPAIVQEEAERRKRRSVPAPDGNLVILAADHPGRNVLNVKDDPLGMADRHAYLARILRVLTSPGIDGIMGTPDLIEDLFILTRLIKERGGSSLLDDRLLVGCMNRGGLRGTAFEMEDTFTAFTTERMQALRMDGAKFMFRLDPTDPASGRTILACADAVSQCVRADLTAFLEPLPVKRVRGKYVVQRTVADLAGMVSIASAMGASSLNTWLKIPSCKGLEQVARATTLPILILGGEVTGDPVPVLQDLQAAMQAGPTIRGALIGRNVIFPGADDPRAMAAAVAALVHDRADVTGAQAVMVAERGKDPRLLP